MKIGAKVGLLGISGALLVIALSPAAPGPEPAGGPGLTPTEQLGKLIFFDDNLSTPPGMSCATCHDPHTGFADPRLRNDTSQGVIRTRFGSRNSPTVAYASHSPEFHLLPGMGPMNLGVYEGGQNWDGRSATLFEQAKLPFVNPLEMNNPNERTVVRKVELGPYAALFREVYGADAFQDSVRAYDLIAWAIVAYESSSEVNPFSSKYDLYLRGQVSLTETEAMGLAVFETKGDCTRCHRSRPAANGAPPMFTSRHHANVGVPRNPMNLYYWQPPSTNPERLDFIELGTGVTVHDPWHHGRVKIPTLRNIALTAPYMHNGVFPDLETVVRFYNTRDVAGMPWDPPEVDHPNIIRLNNLGNLGLTDPEILGIVAFLHTLTDGYLH